MNKHIFINLPVKDLNKSMTFFKALGYSFNPQFTNEEAACMVISDTIFAMLVTEPFFKTFTPHPISNAHSDTEVLVCLSCESRDEVNATIAKAVAAGATLPRQPQDHGFMYEHGFQDLDGHIWEYMWMDPAALQ